MLDLYDQPPQIEIPEDMTIEDVSRVMLAMIVITGVVWFVALIVALVICIILGI